MNPIIEQIGKIGIVPVIALENAEDARPLAQALCRGGLPCAEVTFRTDAAQEAIRIMSEEFPDMLVGAGTVLCVEQVDRAVSAGAKFVVSPGLNPKVVAYCQDKGIPILPGTANPSDVEAALEMGLEAVKFFPAEAAGGIKMIKAMSAPYGNVKFMPTGGINADNLKEYLDFEKVIACGGSWMVKKDLIKAGKFEEIEALAREAVNKMLGYELMHIGINSADEKEAERTAELFGRAFGFGGRDGVSSIFAGDQIEIMKAMGRGSRGHIGIGTNYIDRAVYHLEKQGIALDHSSEKRDEKGKLKLIYLKEEIGGFGVHLIQK
mgnify:CR=1 FL=1